MLKLHSQVYDRIKLELERGVSTFFLLGDKGIGKRTLVRRVLQALDYNVVEFESMSIDAARQLKSTCQRKSETNRAFILNGDGISVISFNALLKLVEEPPEGVKFFICSSYVKLTTIASRCSQIIIPKLSDDDLLQALLFKGMSERVAKTVVPYAGGSVDRALTVYVHLEEKRKMIAYLKALYENDIDFILRNVPMINQQQIILLIELVEDMLNARYALVNNEYVATQISPQFLNKVHEVLRSSRMPEVAWLRTWAETKSLQVTKR